jgi:hypothetical protein
MVVQTRRARSEVVVRVGPRAGGGIAYASARGARILSREEFVAAAEAEGRATRAASLSASIAAEAQATGADVTVPVLRAERRLWVPRQQRGLHVQARKAASAWRSRLRHRCRPVFTWLLTCQLGDDLLLLPTLSTRTRQ